MYDDRWTNKLVNGVHCTRYIVSWIKVYGPEFGRINGPFYKWLESVGVENEEDRDRIFHLATNGRLELENSVHDYLKKNNIKSYFEELKGNRNIGLKHRSFEDFQKMMRSDETLKLG